MNARPAGDEAHRDAAAAAPGDVEVRLRAALRDARREAGILLALLGEME